MPKLFWTLLLGSLFLLDCSEGRRFNFKNLFHRDTEQIRSCESRRSVACTDCKFKCPLNDGRFARPDCKTYYKCMGGEKACLATCPRFTRYDVRWERCLPAGFARCFLEESFDCSNRTGIFRHRRYCDRYFICRNGHAYLRFCPYWYSFDESSNKCKPSMYAQCEEIVPTTAAPPTPTTKLTTAAATNGSSEEASSESAAEAAWETITTTEMREWSTMVTTTNTEPSTSISTSSTTELPTTARRTTSARQTTSTPSTTTVATQRPTPSSATSTTSIQSPTTTITTEIPVVSNSYSSTRSSTRTPSSTTTARATETATENSTTSTTTEASTTSTTTTTAARVTETEAESTTTTTTRPTTEAFTTTMTTTTEAVSEELSTSQMTSTSTTAFSQSTSTTTSTTSTTERPTSNTPISMSTTAPTSPSTVAEEEQTSNTTTEQPTTTTTTSSLSTSTSTVIPSPGTAPVQVGVIDLTTRSDEDVSALVENQNIFQEELFDTESSVLDLSIGTSEFEKSALITSTELPNEPRIQIQTSTTLEPPNFATDDSIDKANSSSTFAFASISTKTISQVSESTPLASVQVIVPINSNATSSNTKLDVFAPNQSLPFSALAGAVYYELHHRPIEEENKLKN